MTQYIITSIITLQKMFSLKAKFLACVYCLVAYTTVYCHSVKRLTMWTF